RPDRLGPPPRAAGHAGGAARRVRPRGVPAPLGVAARARARPLGAAAAGVRRSAGPLALAGRLRGVPRDRPARPRRAAARPRLRRARPGQAAADRLLRARAGFARRSDVNRQGRERRTRPAPAPVEVQTPFALAEVIADPRRPSSRLLLLDGREAGWVDIA